MPDVVSRPAPVVWRVYKGVNHRRREIYFGVSSEAKPTMTGSHCETAARALRHWNILEDSIGWSQLSAHDEAETAIAEVRRLESADPPPGYRHLRTLEEGGGSSGPPGSGRG